ncbi:hypothetical protein Hanom_Chr11g01024091 [Helianthus anomalus]
MEQRQLLEALMENGSKGEQEHSKGVKAAQYRKLRYYRNLRWSIFHFLLHRKPDYFHRSKLKSTVNYGGAVIYGGA